MPHMSCHSIASLGDVAPPIRARESHCPSCPNGTVQTRLGGAGVQAEGPKLHAQSDPANVPKPVTKRHETSQNVTKRIKCGGQRTEPVEVVIDRTREYTCFWHDFGMLLHAYRQACAPSLLSCTIHSFRRAIGHRAHPMSSSGPRHCLSPVRAGKKESVFFGLTVK